MEQIISSWAGTDAFRLGWRRVALWLRNRRTRAALARLTPELAADIGRSMDEVRAEARRSFWED